MLMRRVKKSSRHGSRDDGFDSFLVDRQLRSSGIGAAQLVVLVAQRAAEEGRRRGRGGPQVIDENGGEEVTDAGRLVGAVDALKEALGAQRRKIRDAELPKSANSRRSVVETKRATQRIGDELVEFEAVSSCGSPELRRVENLRDEDGLHQRGCNKRPRDGRVAEVDAADETGGVFGLGVDGLKLLIPSAVGLQGEAEVFVVVNKFEVVGVEGDGGCRKPRFDLVVEEEDLGLGGGKLKLPFLTPALDTGEEVAKNLELRQVGLVVLVLRPSCPVVGKQGEQEAQMFKLVIIEVVDVDGEKQRGEDAALWNPCSGRKPVRALVVLSDPEFTVGEERTKPTPGFASDGGVGVELEKEEVVGYAVERFDDVEEDDWELLSSAELRVHVPKQTVDVVEGGESFTKSCLVFGEELVGLEEVNHAVVDDTFEQANDDAGDADEAVGRRVRAISFFEDGEGIRRFPLFRNDAVIPRVVENVGEGVEERPRGFGDERSSDPIGARSSGATQVLGGSFNFIHCDRSVKTGRVSRRGGRVNEGLDVRSTRRIPRDRRRWVLVAPVGNGRRGHDLRVEGSEVVERFGKTAREIAVLGCSNRAQGALTGGNSAVPRLPLKFLIFRRNLL